MKLDGLPLPQRQYKPEVLSIAGAPLLSHHARIDCTSHTQPPNMDLIYKAAAAGKVWCRATARTSSTFLSSCCFRHDFSRASEVSHALVDPRQIGELYMQLLNLSPPGDAKLLNSVVGATSARVCLRFFPHARTHIATDLAPRAPCSQHALGATRIISRTGFL